MNTDVAPKHNEKAYIYGTEYLFSATYKQEIFLQSFIHSPTHALVNRLKNNTKIHIKVYIKTAVLM